MEKYMKGMDTYNEIENCWEELEKKALPAKYHGKDRNGSQIKPGDLIARSACGGWLLIKTN